jgi:hypothetical protein
VDQPTPDFVPTPAPDLESCALDGEGLVWHGATLHRLDAVGALVWERFDGTTTLGDLARTLAAEFGAHEDEVQRDIARLCSELLDEGLLEGGVRPSQEPRQHLQPGRPPRTRFDPDQKLPYATGRFDALGHHFGIRTNDAVLAAYFDRALRSFAAPGSPTRWYSVVTGETGDEAYRVYFDGRGVLAAPDPDLVVRYLLWHVNSEVIRHSPGHLLIHAAGATLGDTAVALPADMNAGKTTLVAGLVLDGFGFLTDEMVALNLETGLVDPYPRPLNVGRGSWEVLPSLLPPGRDEHDPLPRALWHVDPNSIRPGAVAGPARLGWVIAPRFEAGSTTRLEPISGAEGAVLLHRHAFNRDELGSKGIRALVGAVRRTRCARLVNGDLVSAVSAVRGFLAESASA